MAAGQLRYTRRHTGQHHLCSILLCPAGHYADSDGFFINNSVDRAPLHALAAGVDGANGLYVYAFGGAFPINTFHSENYWVDLVFVTSVAQTWSITGAITPAASGSGTTLTLSGAATGTTTANSGGNYTFSGLADGAYTVTPSKTGFAFSPVSANVTVSGANATAPTFTISALPTWSISGTVSPQPAAPERP